MDETKLTAINYPSEQDIVDRHQGVQSIAEKVQCIKEIYQDLSELITVQGENIDLLETNCEKASGHTQKGLVQLQEASKNQRRCSIM